MLYHDSRDKYYRTPSGSGACLSRITLRLKALPTDRVFLRLWWNEREQLIEMYPVSKLYPVEEMYQGDDLHPEDDLHQGDDLHPGDELKTGARLSPVHELYPVILNPADILGSIDELYEATIMLPAHSGNLWYYFIIERAKARVWYGNAKDGQGGVGKVYDEVPPAYQITVYDPAYQTPTWMRESILYQIMVDRFHTSKPMADKATPYMGWLHDDWYEAPALRNDSGPDNEANDFFGGDLEGVLEKLPYLKDLGVTALYFNPIFQARSNHKYDTGDYLKIDPAFGDESDFRALTDAVQAEGMHVILDGVFSHTGADSRYFNLRSSYDSVGAYQSPSSPYAQWYTFKHWPDDYVSWWGFATLPNVNEMNDAYLDFIIRGSDAVCAHWLRAGASGWRLDVADELPLPFLKMLRTRVKQESPDACILGEVWEDASNKLTYGEMRNYCTGDTLDSVMNYPLRDGVIGFMTGHLTAGAFVRMYEHLQENYAPPFFYSLMNMLGSHDKPRIIDVLSGVNELEPPREKRHARKLTRTQYRIGHKRFIAAWRFVCALPGMPCLYYADEAGQTGMADPFCRATYPWGQEDKTLLRQIKKINHARLESRILKTGELKLYAPCDDVIVVARRIVNGCDVFGHPAENGIVLCALNRSSKAQSIALTRDEFINPIALTLDAMSSVLIHP